MRALDAVRGSDMADLVLPQLGETVTEGTITRWFKGVGDSITVGELLYEVSTDKVDSEVPSPMEGVISEIRVPEGETVDVGTVLAIVEVSEGAVVPPPAAPVADTSAAAAPAPVSPPAEPAPVAPSEVPVAAAAAAASIDGAASGSARNGSGRLLSPVVRRLVREHSLDPAALVGTGVGGRITRSDVLNAIDEQKRSAAATAPTAPARATSPAGERAAAPSPPSVPAPVAAAAAAEWTDGDSRFEAFNNIRRRTGEHMVNSVATSPHALTVVEVDYENVEQVRRAHREAWRASEGFSLTYLPFIVIAVADALAHWPRLNASVEDDGLRIRRRRNIGVAVDLDYDGLIVPVLRDADSLSLRGVARTMNELATRARERRLTPDDITGGTFTISNNGSFGTYTTAAIINQPQVAVLSTDGVARRPVVVADRFGNESIVVHSVGHLAMGWDHRAFDGSYAAGFLGHIRQMLEQHDWGAEL
ncbi:dihydrolipoamide acetyltransferase family protein [Candidatus Poriferisodalis sp.]|uniref:dihydrolipoamide acetyltransferase family protein n=1 Tax=Candidatus Poriferisodalis sp. TaxID=3101277 RepID=UPI003AF94724